MAGDRPAHARCRGQTRHLSGGRSGAVVRVDGVGRKRRWRSDVAVGRSENGGVVKVAWTLLAAALLVASSPDFFSPYPPNRQHRDQPYAQPGRYGAVSVQWL